jgi:hypothetical protein
MGLPLKESRAVRELAEVLYEFLPGSGNAKWKGHVSFKTVADKVGVGDFWQPGSKLPMVVSLLERTLEFRRGKLEQLILEAVRGGLTYRQKNENPVAPEEIDKINGLILEIGFKFPDLWDKDFRASLCADGGARAAKLVERALTEDSLREAQRSQRAQELGKLRSEFLALHQCADRQKAGFSLERILTRLFELYGLYPREPFRVVGEQIDGSFELDHEVYLLEAKWHGTPLPAADLYVFREKVEGKSKFTRGVLVSINGVGREAQEAITRGKQPNFFTVDGYDILMLLEENMELPEFLRTRQRLLAEQGSVFKPFGEIAPL